MGEFSQIPSRHIIIIINPFVLGISLKKANPARDYAFHTQGLFLWLLLLLEEDHMEMHVLHLWREEEGTILVYATTAS